MNSKRRLLAKFIGAQKKLVFLTFITGFFLNAVITLLPISIGKFYEFTFGFSSHRLAALNGIPFIHAKEFISFIYLFFGLVFLRFVLEFSNKYLISILGEKFSKIIREKLFAHQLQITMDVYQEKGIGRYLLRYSGDLKSIQDYIKNGIIRFLQDVILLLLVIAVVYHFSPDLAYILVFFLFIAMVFLWLVNKKLYTASMERRNRKSGMLAFVNTRLRGILTVKVFNKYQPEIKRYRKRSDQLYRIGKKYAGITAFIHATVPAITYGMLGAVMVYAFSLSQKNTSDMDSASLLVLILLITAMLPVLRRTLKVSMIWKLGDISLTKLIAILDLPSENNLPFDKGKSENFAIRFKNVSFSYSKETKPIFEKFNCNLEANTITLIKGTSGSGKSTLIKLLVKLLQAQKGEILFGNQPYDELSEKTIRKQIALISKDFPLYGKDVYEAVCYLRNDKTKDKTTRLLQSLQQHEAVSSHIFLDTPIGDLGNALTSGQQKIAMYCRVFLTNKPILLIENPTQSLNKDTAAFILKTLEEMKKKKCIILFNDQEILGCQPDQLIDLG